MPQEFIVKFFVLLPRLLKYIKSHYLLDSVYVIDLLLHDLVLIFYLSKDVH